MNDTVQSIRRSSYRFLSGTLLSRFTGMFRDISMAYVFGTQPSIAAFMVAFRFAHLLRRLFGEGALQSAFIPEFEELRHRDPQRAAIFFRDLNAFLSLFLFVLIIGASVVLSAILYWGNLSSGNYEILYYTMLMLPSLLFICLFGLNLSLLQCEKSYFIPGVAPVAFNVMWIVIVLGLNGVPIETAVPWLCGGVVLACLAQWMLTVPQTVSKVKGLSANGDVSISFSSPDLKRLIKPLSLGILGVAASQINSAVDALFARFADPEGPAFLWYAIRIQQLPLALFGIAVAGAVLPPLSRAIKSGNNEAFHHFLHDALLRTSIFMLPLSISLFVLGDTGVAFLYGRGDFTFHSSMQTTYCLWAYAIGLLPSAWVLVLAPACYAQKNYSLPAIASFITMTLNGVLNTLFVVYFQWGAMSIALATSISAWVNFMFLVWSLSRKGVSLFPPSQLQAIFPSALGSLAAAGGTYAFRLQFEELAFLSPLFDTASFLNQFGIIALESFIYGVIFVVVFFFFSHVLKPFNQFF